ncbi:P-loop containing nucleoside triphosphate hydrolase protein, partial [Haematococcus lacustris]
MEEPFDPGADRLFQSFCVQQALKRNVRPVMGCTAQRILPSHNRPIPAMSSDRYPRDVVGDGRLQVIAALPTGSGKTRIAIRVIQGMLPRLPEGSTVVFLAPTVPLCAQQADVLTEAGLRVALVCGGVAVTVEQSRPQGQAAFTPGCPLTPDHLTLPGVAAESLQPMITLTQCYSSHGQSPGGTLLVASPALLAVALLVLDEVHHADKDHPYAAIARQFVAPLAAGGRAPRLLGLTASPVQLLEGMKSAAQACSLEVLLGAHIITAPCRLATSAANLKLRPGCRVTPFPWPARPLDRPKPAALAREPRVQKLFTVTLLANALQLQLRQELARCVPVPEQRVVEVAPARTSPHISDLHTSLQGCWGRLLCCAPLTAAAAAMLSEVAEYRAARLALAEQERLAEMMGSAVSKDAGRGAGWGVGGGGR